MQVRNARDVGLLIKDQRRSLSLSQADLANRIGAMVEENMINLRTFYRGNYRMVGVSNMDHDNIISAEMMDWLRPGFESGLYKAFPIKDDAVYGLDKAVEGYKRVLKDLTRDRIVIDPKT